jgi:hypothetical protein
LSLQKNKRVRIFTEKFGKGEKLWLKTNLFVYGKGGKDLDRRSRIRTEQN